MASLRINKGVPGRMSSGIHTRLETAVSTILVQLTYEQLQHVGAAAMTVSILIWYGCVQAGRRVAGAGFVQQVLLRSQAVLIGLLGNVFLSCIQIGAGASSSRLLVAKLAVLSCVLVFLGVVLQPVRGQFNLVGICLFVFSDSLEGQLASERDALVVVFVSAVVCAASPLVAQELDARVPGLGVLLSALFMATVNWLLDLIRDTVSSAGQHCAMLLLVAVGIEVCKSVDPALAETQGYAIYRVTAVLGAYLRRVRVDSGIVAVAGLLALLAARKLETRWTLARLATQILVLLVVNAVVSEFKAVVKPLPAASKGIALAVLLVFFEAARGCFG